MLLKHLNFVLFARQAVAGRSINRITEQYAVIANCDPTRASYASADYRKLHWARLCVSPLIQLHYSRRTRCMTPASITSKYGLQARPNFSAASAWHANAYRNANENKRGRDSAAHRNDSPDVTSDRLLARLQNARCIVTRTLHCNGRYTVYTVYTRIRVSRGHYASRRVAVGHSTGVR